MRDSLLFDTINVWEYSVKFNHNIEIDLPYDPSLEVYVLGGVVYFYYLIKRLY